MVFPITVSVPWWLNSSLDLINPLGLVYFLIEDLGLHHWISILLVCLFLSPSNQDLNVNHPTDLCMHYIAFVLIWKRALVLFLYLSFLTLYLCAWEPPPPISPLLFPNRLRSIPLFSSQDAF